MTTMGGPVASGGSEERGADAIAASLPAIRAAFAHAEGIKGLSGSSSWVYLDHGVGSLVLERVAARAGALASMGWNSGGPHPASVRYGELIARGRAHAAALLGCSEASRVIMGESASALTNTIARAVVRTLPAGSRVLVTATDHDANIDPWHHALWELGGDDEVARRLRLVRHDPLTGSLDVDDLAVACAEGPVGLLAVSAASNILGSFNDVPRVVDTLRAAWPDAWIIVDAVHAAPHGLPDLDGWGVDAVLLSPYKLYSVHGHGLAACSARLLELPHAHIRSAATAPPSNWEQGTRDPVAWSCVSETVAYHAALGAPGGVDEAALRGTPMTGRPAGATWTDEDPIDAMDTATLRARLVTAYERIAVHERDLTARLLWGDAVGEHAAREAGGLVDQSHVRVFGSTEREHAAAREPTASFDVPGIGGFDVVERIWDEHRVAVRCLDGYTDPVFEQLGVTEVVRVSATHMNTVEEIDRFLVAVASLA